MLNPTVKFHIFMTISHFFVCRTTLKSTTLEQQVCSRTQMHYNWQQTVSKEKNVATLYITHYAITQKTAQLWQWLVRTITGQFTQVLLNLVNLRDFLCVGTKLKESIFKNNNQINSNVTTRTWVLSTEWPERGQLQDWYPKEKMEVVPVCLNGRCCSLGCVGIASC